MDCDQSQCPSGPGSQTALSRSLTLQGSQRNALDSNRRTWSCWSESRGDQQDDQRDPYEEMLRELGWFTLVKRRPWRDLTVAFEYLKADCKKDGERLLYETGVMGQGGRILN
ncbi:hypothetical protein DUI87_08544 [Hirundo rustica rustica]|uniref:Uncharacterized protein n=1 Tax=Hirundo rustica rustica TaxID=333673 RepID=A0A3M0KLE9_HIRRU|nr:hypothetical protein DUI87_08544 [Hirundo rustica rustica]